VLISGGVRCSLSSNEVAASSEDARAPTREGR
jgi:hypothetical protein